MTKETCAFCGCGRRDDRPGCSSLDCPGNPDEKPGTESPELLKVIRDEMIRMNLRWHGLPVPGKLPNAGASKVYVSDLWRYIRGAMRVVREFERKKTS